MNDSRKKLNVLPFLAAVALLLAVAALATAVVAIGKSDDTAGILPAGSSGSMPGMSPEDMEHMAPLPMTGIAEPPSDKGNTRLESGLRGGVLELTLDARPVRWRIYGKQPLAAYAYNGIVPGPQVRLPNGQRVRVRFTNDLPVETTINWHRIDVPNSQDGVPSITRQVIKPGASYAYEFTARSAVVPRQPAGPVPIPAAAASGPWPVSRQGPRPGRAARWRPRTCRRRYAAVAGA